MDLLKSKKITCQHVDSKEQAAAASASSATSVTGPRLLSACEMHGLKVVYQNGAPLDQSTACNMLMAYLNKISMAAPNMHSPQPCQLPSPSTGVLPLKLPHRAASALSAQLTGSRSRSAHAQWLQYLCSSMHLLVTWRSYPIHALAHLSACCPVLLIRL